MNQLFSQQLVDDLARHIDSVPDAQPEGRTCAGLVLIAHGYDTKITGEPRWTGYMQRSIIQRLHSNGRAGRLHVRQSHDDWTVELEWLKPYPDDPSDCECFLRVDWTAAANHLLHPISTERLAQILVASLAEHQTDLPDLRRHPIHLIGHSRGASLVCEMAALLGQEGILIDQVTTLDPHPLTANDPQPLLRPVVQDASIHKHSCIRFMDNYWQDITYPQGQVVSGAINYVWHHLPDGYHGTLYSAFADHMNVILAYQASISEVLPLDNDEARLEAATLEKWRQKNNLADLPPGYRFSHAMEPQLRQNVRDQII